jgi:fatty-acyl-CoA synthase
MVLPSSNLQPEVLIKILEDEKVTKANGVPTIWLGIYDAMKKNPKEKLALEEYIVGGSALPKVLLKVSKRFGIKEFKLGNDRNISFRYSFKITTKAYPFIRKRKLDIRAKQGIAFPGVEIRIMTDEGTLAPTDGKKA